MMQMLTGWKSIAASLGVSVSTAKKYHYQGKAGKGKMPVYHEGNRQVWAKYSEIEKWRDKE